MKDADQNKQKKTTHVEVRQKIRRDKIRAKQQKNPALFKKKKREISTVKEKERLLKKDYHKICVERKPQWKGLGDKSGGTLRVK